MKYKHFKQALLFKVGSYIELSHLINGNYLKRARGQSYHILWTAGFAAFGSSTSGYGYSPPSATLWQAPFFSDIPFFSSFACDRTFYVRMSFWMGNALSSQPFALWLVAFGCFGIKFYRSGVADILLFLKQITCRCLGMWIFFTYIKKTAKNSYCLHNCLRKQRIVCTFASSKG